jgi:hypothetical protein
LFAFIFFPTLLLRLYFFILSSDHSPYWGRRYPCGLHADANNGEGIALDLNRLVSGLDARTVGARSVVIKGKQDVSVQRKFFDALTTVHKIRSVAYRMENKVIRRRCLRVLF